MKRLETRRDLLIAFGLFIIVLFLVPTFGVLSAHFATKEFQLSDEGIVVYTGYRASLGQLPHLAFPYYYAGGLEIILGALFNTLGTTFGVARWALGLCMAFTVLLIYLVYAVAGIHRATAVIGAVVSVGYGYLMNYHVHPAWFAVAFVPLGMLFLVRGLRHGSVSLILLAGVCTGVSSAFKQTTGIFVLLSFILFTTFIPPNSERESEPERKELKTRFPLGEARFAAVMIGPVMIFVFLVYLISSNLTVLNIVLFLTIPALVIVLSMKAIWNVGRTSARVRRSFVQFCEKTSLLLVCGFFLGLLPIMIYYFLHGGIENFLNDSFLKVHSAMTHTVQLWTFAMPESTADPLIMFRRLVVHSVPFLAIVGGLVFSFRRMRKNIYDRSTVLLLLNSLTLSILHFSLFPLPETLYLLYLLPLIALPFMFALDSFLKSKVSSGFLRAAATVLILVIVVGFYWGSRLFTPEWQNEQAISSEVTLIDHDRGDIYVPRHVADYLAPVINYLNGRPKDESFAAIDRLDAVVAFLTSHPTVVNYSQLFYLSSGYSGHHYRDLKVLAEKHKIDTIILGRPFLRNTPGEQELFQYLAGHYKPVLNTLNYLGYQRISVY
jgi:hypothetical protein